MSSLPSSSSSLELLPIFIYSVGFLRMRPEEVDLLVMLVLMRKGGGPYSIVF
jgi:hypothetical protein